MQSDIPLGHHGIDVVTGDESAHAVGKQVNVFGAGRFLDAFNVHIHLLGILGDGESLLGGVDDVAHFHHAGELLITDHIAGEP